MAGMVFTFRAVIHCDGWPNTTERCTATAEATVAASAAPVCVSSVPDDLPDMFHVDLPEGWKRYGREDWHCPACVARLEEMRAKWRTK